MKLTKDQDKAMKAIAKWLKEPISADEWIFSLAGFAGTGKTTLLHKLINDLPKRPVCCAPTGKAASVLRRKLPGIPVRTVHQVLYTPQGQSMALLQRLEMELQDLLAKETEYPAVEAKKREIHAERQRLTRDKVTFQLKSASDVLPGSLIIVDEASMLSGRMLEDFQALQCKLLLVGDPGQLPPVKDEPWFKTRRHDAFLEEIVRQALDSPIIRLSQQIRTGVVQESEFREGDCQIIHKDKVAKEQWLAADQVLTGGNDSRRKLNRFFRKALGRHNQTVPVAGDKLICLKNDHYKLPPWINGVQLEALGDLSKDPDGSEMLEIRYEGIPERFEFYPWHCQLHYDPNLPEEPRELRKGLFEADYAYAITVHKSQGSEWPSVIVADDRMRNGDKEFRKQWLYTAVTRAKEKLMLVCGSNS